MRRKRNQYKVYKRQNVFEAGALITLAASLTFISLAVRTSNLQYALTAIIPCAIAVAFAMKANKLQSVIRNREER